MWNFEEWWQEYLEAYDKRAGECDGAIGPAMSKCWARENIRGPMPFIKAQALWETREREHDYVTVFNRTFDVPGYEKLRNVLERAYDQAAVTKGAERHANDRPFHEQPMQTIADRRGIGFILGQVDKKTEEGQGMIDRGENEAAVRELLGAIVYLAGAVIFLEK